MTFGSLFFLTVFLPPVLAGHWVLQWLGTRRASWTKVANAWLLAASIVACVLSDLRGLPFFLACAVGTDLLARAIAGSRSPRLRRAFLATALAANLGLLCFFKYAGVLARWADALAGSPLVPVPELTLPLGVRFWVFRAMSYVCDVSRGVHPPARNPLDFLCYLALFPIFVSGPIVRWAEVADAFRSRPFSTPLAASGFRRLLVGLAKKILVANQLAPFADAVWGLADGGHGMPPGMAALGVAAYALQLYFDFSGYSDMAIGIGRMLGFDIRENFLWPYASASIREFWRRWHISLSTWFREYLYIPLGGNRCSKVKWIRNLFLVWAATGIWHGASWNYLLWGLYYFVWLLLEKLVLGRLLERLPGFLRRVYVVVILLVGWAIFALEDFAQLRVYLGAMFGFGGAALFSGTAGYELMNYLPMLIVGILGATPLASSCFRQLPEGCRRWVRPVLLVLGLLLSTAYLVAGTYNPFLYFRF